jgi:hypothetical protein
LKLAIPVDADLDELGQAFRALGAHLSRNARKPVIGGLQERFVTIRSFGVGPAAADARFEAVMALVRARGLNVRDRVREYTVYDSAMQADRGWAS